MSSSTKNSAFVFIKPHAHTDLVVQLAKDGLAAKGITILSEGVLTGEVIDEKKLIDQHYYAIASKATILKPNELNVPVEKFQEQFGLTWEEALASGKVYNALDGCAKLGISGDEMDTQWGICKKAKKLIKFGGGFYCGLIEMEGKESIYAFNGFFMSMREKFTAPGTSIYYFVVEFDSAALKWSDFRGQVLGPTDPAEAPADSLRGRILKEYKELGLTGEPNVGDNGMHASASPFEGLAERMNWCGATLEDDKYGALLLENGISAEFIKTGSVDPQVTLPAGGKGSLFDAVEDMDATECMETLKAIAALN